MTISLSHLYHCDYYMIPSDLCSTYSLSPLILEKGTMTPGVVIMTTAILSPTNDLSPNRIIPYTSPHSSSNQFQRKKNEASHHRPAQRNSRHPRPPPGAASGAGLGLARCQGDESPSHECWGGECESYVHWDGDDDIVGFNIAFFFSWFLGCICLDSALYMLCDGWILLTVFSLWDREWEGIRLMTDPVNPVHIHSDQAWSTPC